MNFVRDIKRKLGTYVLRKRIKGLQRKKKLIDIRSAGSVAILFILEDQKVYHLVHDFLQEFQRKKIKVKAIGFTDSKHMSGQFLPVLSFDFIDRKSLNWIEIPRQAIIRDFVEAEFDICINIAPETCFPLQYIAAMSKARLKAGTYRDKSLEDVNNDQQHIYDILVKSEEPYDQGEALKNIHEYLLILNSGKNDGKI